MSFLKVFSGAADRLQASVANAVAYKGNKDVLEGKVAAQLLVAYSDGDCSAEEEQEAIDTLKGDKALEIAGFTQNDIVDTWTKLSGLRPNRPTGKIQLRREIAEAVARAGNNMQIGEDIFLGACNIAYADGTVNDAEKAELKEIAKACGVKPEALGITL